MSINHKKIICCAFCKNLKVEATRFFNQCLLLFSYWCIINAELHMYSKLIIKQLGKVWVLSQLAESMKSGSYHQKDPISCSTFFVQHEYKKIKFENYASE